MSTQAQPIFNRNTPSPTRPNIKDVARKLLALRSITNVTGYSLTKMTGSLLEQLTLSELVTLGELFLEGAGEGQSTMSK